MKTIKSIGLYNEKVYSVNERKLPYKFAVVGMPHQKPAFAYLSDSYRDDMGRLNDCNSYRVFPSLKQALDWVENNFGHQGCESGRALAEALERAGVIEKFEEVEVEAEEA